MSGLPAAAAVRRGRVAFVTVAAFGIALAVAAAIERRALSLWWRARALERGAFEAAEELAAAGPDGVRALEGVALAPDRDVHSSVRRAVFAVLARRDFPPGVAGAARLDLLASYVAFAGFLDPACRERVRRFARSPTLEPVAAAGALERGALATDGSRAHFALEILEARASDGDRAAGQLLARVVRESSSLLARARAMQALARAPDALPEDVRALARRWLDERDDRLGRAAGGALVAKDGAPHARARELFRHESASVRLGAAIGLGIADRGALVKLVLGHPDPSVRREALSACCPAGEPGWGLLASRALRDQDEGVRIRAAGLGDWGGRVDAASILCAVAAFRTAGPPDVREIAGWYLVRRRDPRSIATCVAALAQIDANIAHALDRALCAMTGELATPEDGWSAWLVEHRGGLPEQLDPDDCFRRTSGPGWTVAPIASLGG